MSQDQVTLNAMPPAIEVRDVHFAYPDGHQVLKGVTCQIHPGEKVALIGPNGAGKSTFMSHLNGVVMASQGEVRINGTVVAKETLNEVRRQVGIVFQDPDDQLFCPTVFDDVAFGPLNLGLDREAIRVRVQEALETVGLSGFEERSSFHLSFGERKRLALATVLSYHPQTLVFDEPSTNMDPLNRRKLIEWLQQTDNTILLCTHDLDIALEVCDRCLLLVDGRILADGSVKEILYNRTLLESNNLEMPLALMTHELLHDLLHATDMDEEHRRIIGEFLHNHRFAHHQPTAAGHSHVHSTADLHRHLHEDHAHDIGAHHHEHYDHDHHEHHHSDDVSSEAQAEKPAEHR